MPRFDRWSAHARLATRALALAQAIATTACGVTIDDAVADQALTTAGAITHPTFWTAWTTDGAPPVEAGGALLARGLRCSGRYCDDLGLLAVDSGYRQTASWWTDSFSEEGQN
jgi:hypothetical protein